MLSLSAAGRLSAGARLTHRASSSRSLVAPRTAARHCCPPTSRSSLPRLVAAATPLLRAQIPYSLFYSTERVVSLRSGKGKDRLPRTIYDASRETENCGVGLVASLKSIASRKVVEDADEMLVRMSHRGGVGCCPASGDGAGECVLRVLERMCGNFSD